jgi:hypothetical protein
MKDTSFTELKVEFLPIKDLLPYQRALRKNAKAVERMVASIREYGFKIPLLVSEQNVIIDGELRFKAAQKLRFIELPVIVCRDWTAAQVNAFRLMASRSATWAEWDLEAVAQEIAELSQTGFDLKLTGFDAREIDDLLSPVFDDETLESVPETPKVFGGNDSDTATGHGTQKPVELMRRPMLNHTERGAIVYDPFLGSGSTLAAAEDVGRVCYGVEIDAAYVDTIVLRWQKLTAKAALLEGEGRTFDQIRTERGSSSEAEVRFDAAA